MQKTSQLQEHEDSPKGATSALWEQRALCPGVARAQEQDSQVAVGGKGAQWWPNISSHRESVNTVLGFQNREPGLRQLWLMKT